MSENDPNTEIFKVFSVFGQTKCHGLVRSNLSAGPIGVHADLNVNTGVGICGGNLDLHLL